ncbi:Rha family transcriptional regulator [Escherichia coli]|uniref:Rha family phage regulatory protein n=1 Tax=Escherichia coli TaxID=562 RepID=UPI003D93A720|nr:Rha family transcriptional regulator [Escherichia coli]
MLNVAIENQNGWNYSAPAPHKTGAGIGLLLITLVPEHAPKACFLLPAFHYSMAAQAGASHEAPGSDVTGKANPVWATTNQIGLCGGGSIAFTSEDAIMATIPTLSHPDVTIKNGRAVTTSIAIAEFFGKRHDNVLRAIANIECSEKFNALNFEDVTYTDAKGEKRPMYQITKNGFVFLVMGFTGKKAAAFKEAYIAEFDRMEEELRQNNAPSPDKMIHGDGRTLVIRLDEHGNIKFTETVPDGAMVCTLDTFQFYLEKQGWTLVNRSAIKNMTVEQLLKIHC